jgi:uncharacterized protein (TIGR03435 family)
MALACTLGLAQPAFDVAAVKLNRSGAVRMLLRPEPTGVTIANMPLKSILMYVYDARFDQISGGPAWIDQDRWDIAAKSETKLDDPQRRRLLQSLIEERFRLLVRRESREGQIFALVVAKNGPKLRPPSGPTEELWVRNTGAGLLRLNGRRASMPKLAAMLERTMAKTVLDQTDLPGDFDFEAEWAPDAGVTPGVPPPVPMRDGQPTPPGDGVSVFTALQNRLGLKLDARRGPVVTFVVQHAEKPAQN